MKKLFSRFMKDESGATAIEYGLIAALIAVAIIVAVSTVGNETAATFSKVGDSLNNANKANIQSN
jgi:pilus assembly protein Flp/PilA